MSMKIPWWYLELWLDFSRKTLSWRRNLAKPTRKWGSDRQVCRNRELSNSVGASRRKRR